jgi:DDE family transposase
MQVIPDQRDPCYTAHSQLSLLRQRVYGLCLGYEDLNDHTDLRRDPAFQTAINRGECLASQSTLCRLENRIDCKAAIDIHRVIVDQFIASFDTVPEELILDFDATDDPLHGDQEGRFFHGYYDRYCFLLLYVFYGDRLLVSYLHPSNIDGAKHAWAILALLVKRLRQHWPKVKIIFRGDSGFCRHKMLNWCERYEVDYISSAWPECPAA